MFSIKAIILKTASLTCIAGLLVVANLPLFSAFEAHIINVTAEIVNDMPSIIPPSDELCNGEIASVELSVTLAGASIYYTIDGSNPVCGSNGVEYSGSAFTFTGADETKTVKARSCHYEGTELIQSAIVSGDFVFVECEEDFVCGPCDGKITELTLQYNGSTASAIKVVQKSDDDIVFEGTVNPGGQFSFVGTWKDKNTTLGTEITIYVDNVEHVKIHTSCSEPIGLGMVFGDFLVIAGESRNGGPLCPGVVLNEFLPNPDSYDYLAKPYGEWVELYNLFDQAFDLSGYYLTDGDGDRINVENCRTNTGGTMIAGNGFLVVYRNGGDGCGSNSFDLNNLNSQTEDTISLFNSADTKFDEYTYTLEGACSLTPTPDGSNINTPSGECNTEVPPNKSYARIPDGVGDWVDPIPTPGAPNILEEYPVALSGPAPDVVYNSSPAELPIEEPLVEELATELPVEETPVEEGLVLEEDPPVEDPLAEESPVEDPIVEFPVEDLAEEPTIEDPAVSEGPAVSDPPAEDPIPEDPLVEDPPVEEPVTSEPPVEKPPVEEPPTEDPPVEEEPPVEEPVPEDPPVEEPVPEDPPVEEPVE